MLKKKAAHYHPFWIHSMDQSRS